MRSEKGFSQDQIAELVGVDRSTVAKWETGKAYPRVEILIKLSEIFGCTTDELLKGDDPDRLQSDNNA